MISKIRNLIQKKEKDNRGAALVMVIVAIAFIGMLVGMVLYMAYCNYLMKNNDKIAKNNFYSAEYVLDILNAGLQHDISEAMSTAYVEVMGNSKGLSSDEMSADFQDLYIDELKEKLQHSDPSGTYPEQWSLTHLTDIWNNSGVSVASVAGDQGAYICAVNGNNEMKVADSKNYITLSNVQVVYTDDRGYVSIITTDLRLKTPDINFAQSAAKLNLENYSIIANDSLINDNSGDDGSIGISINTGSDATITGNVFGGYDGVEVGNQMRLKFEKNAQDNAAGSTKTYNLISESLTVDNTSAVSSGLYVDSSYVTYVNDIMINSGRVDLDGEMFVGDDMDIAGKNSNVTLSGTYRGYGNMLGKADGSSSILINGAESELDFSGLKEMVLSGHAYVGAKKYDADVDRLAYAAQLDDTSTLESDKIEDLEEYEERLSDPTSTFTETKNTIPKNETDVMMGESISVKANQLLYMVPSDCVGYKIGTDTQVIAKNPMTYNEYKMLTDTETDKLDADGNKVIDQLTGEPVKEKVYEPVRLSALWDRLGGIAYTNDYRAVYRRVNGTVLVYLYLDFGSSETMANAFYKAYYDYDKEGIQAYVKSYIKDMTWSSDLQADGAAKLTLGGNAFMMDRNGEIVFLEDSLLDSDKYLNMITMQELHSTTYEALMHTLSKDYEMMTSEQQNSEIFDYLTDDAKLSSFSGADFKDETSTVYAKISENDVVYPDDCNNGTALIVAKGNVFLKEDFEGLVLAGGNIYICSGCSNIDYNPALVIQAMRTKATVGADEVYAYEVFGNSGVISYGVAASGEETADKTIDLGDLITYENWKKE